MAQVVYILCAVTALACAALLLRGYARSGTRLLLWSGLCFVGLTVNNVLVFADLVVFPTVNILPWRHVTALASIAVLLVGLVWESR